MRRLLAVLLFVLLWANNALAAGEKGNPKVDDRAVIAVLVSAVRPAYPYEAWLRRIRGRGVAVLKIDRATGKGVSCEMGPGTGSEILGGGAAEAFRRGAFKAGKIP